MDREKRFAVHSVFHLLMRQVKDPRFRKLLTYSNLDQLVHVLHTVLGCFEVCDAIAMNAASGRVLALHDVGHLSDAMESLTNDADSIPEIALNPSGLNDFQISAIVESLMAIDNKVKGCGNGLMVDRFLLIANGVLTGLWTRIPEMKKQNVEKAVRNLGFTLPEFRKVIHSLALQVPTAILVTYEKFQEDTIEDVTSEISLDSDSLSSVEPIHKEESKDPVSEMRSWEEIGAQKSEVEKLKTAEVASALASFLVNYETKRVQGFVELKQALSKHFFSSFIYGSSFTIADQDEKEELLWIASSAIGEVVQGKARDFFRMRLRLFMGKLT